MSQKRLARTSYEQYEIYLHEMENDPLFRASITNPNSHEVITNLHYINQKWQDIALKLNSCNSGPYLDAHEWRKRLNDWKNLTNHKFRKICEEQTRLWDYPHKPKAKVTALERRALAIWSKDALNINKAEKSANNIRIKEEEASNSDPYEDQNRCNVNLKDDENYEVSDLSTKKYNKPPKEVSPWINNFCETKTADSPRSSINEEHNNDMMDYYNGGSSESNQYQQVFDKRDINSLQQHQNGGALKTMARKLHQMKLPPAKSHRLSSLSAHNK